MAKPQTQTVNLGALQLNAETAAKTLKTAQRALIKAQNDYETAVNANDRARASLNSGFMALKAAIVVADLSTR